MICHNQLGQIRYHWKAAVIGWAMPGINQVGTSLADVNLVQGSRQGSKDHEEMKRSERQHQQSRIKRKESSRSQIQRQAGGITRHLGDI